MAKTTAAKTTKGPLSAEHLTALETGRRESRAVKDYMEALEENRPKRGRKRTATTVKDQIVAVEDALLNAGGVERVLLLQKRADLGYELATLEEKVDMGPLEDAFVKAAASYSERKGISYWTWREAGVAPAVLKRAGITRSGG